MKCSQIDVIEVQVLNDYTLCLTFSDGAHGNVDISTLIPFEGIFEPLKNKDYFARVTVNQDIGTICWDNGADLSPSLLRKNIQI